MNFNVPLHPPYYIEIWYYKDGNAENIQKSILIIDWKKRFKNENRNEKSRILTDTLLSIFNNFIPLETKTFDYKRLKWMNSFTISSL